jgi:predicted MPP superfamily phosphohydrolase
MSMTKTKKRRHTGSKLFLLLIILTVILIYDSNTRISTEEYEIYDLAIPYAFDGYRIVQLSDVHAAEFGENNEKLLNAVREAQPDIIVITGDMIDADDQNEVTKTLLSGLTDISPVYYVTGNHEWDSGGLNELFDTLDSLGVTALRNEYVRLELGAASIVLAGAEDPNGPADMMKPEELVRRIRQAEGNSFLVMLNHRNDRLDLYASLGVDLVLCGHAHGGLIRLPFTDGLIGPKREWLPEFTNGIYTKNETKMLVSRGIGNQTGYPRFLNNPHIPVAVLRQAT